MAALLAEPAFALTRPVTLPESLADNSARSRDRLISIGRPPPARSRRIQGMTAGGDRLVRAVRLWDPGRPKESAASCPRPSSARWEGCLGRGQVPEPRSTG